MMKKGKKHFTVHTGHQTPDLSLSRQAFTTLCYIRIRYWIIYLATELHTAGSSAPKHPFFQVQWLTATLIYLQCSFFVCSISVICSIHLLFATLVFICSVLFLFAAYFFLFAAYFFYLQRTFFICSVLFLFAAYFFYLQRTFFICSVLFFYLQRTFFYLQRFFFVCSVSLMGHRKTLGLPRILTTSRRCHEPLNKSIG